MTTTTFEPLRAFLMSLAPLPEDEWRAFEAGLQPSNLATGETFLRSGASAAKAGFVVKGLVKAFYLTSKGDEYIRSFTPENGLLVALTAQLRGDSVSDLTFVALEPTDLIVFDYAHYRDRMQKHWAWQQIGRLLAEEVYLLRERRQFELLTMNAEMRLRAFMRQFPGQAARISQKDLAGYIGITPVSLSRLRAKVSLT